MKRRKRKPPDFGITAAIMAALGALAKGVVAAAPAATTAAGGAGTAAAATGAATAGSAATAAGIGGLGAGAGGGGLVGALGSIPELGLGEGVVVGQTAPATLTSPATLSQAIVGGGAQALPSGYGTALGASPSYLSAAAPIAQQLAGPAGRMAASRIGGRGGGAQAPQTQPRRVNRPPIAALGPVGGQLLSAVAPSAQRDFLLRLLMNMGQQNLGR